MKGMILAAGIGSRLRPITNKIPKALLPVHNRPLLDYSIGYLKKYGINDIIINVHHHAHQIIDFVQQKKYSNTRIEFSDETPALLDTGGGVKKASWFFEGESHFVLIASDIITNLNLAHLMIEHKKSNASATLAVKSRETSRSLLFDSDNNLAGWRDNRKGILKLVDNKQPAFDAGFSGIHVISTGILDVMPEGPFSITDFYLDNADKLSIKAFRHDEDTWIEFGRIEKIHQLENSDTIEKTVNW